MSDATLNKTETTILTEAAGQAGRIATPERLKPTTRDRLLGRFLRDGLIAADEEGNGHRLTAAGYRAVGLEPPRVVRSGSKQALVLELLGRGEGASLDELIAVTGWLPHSTRAVLSRLRTGGTALAKTARPEGGTAYRIEAAAA